MTFVDLNSCILWQAPNPDVPRNWADLLNPKWKGQIGMDKEEYFWYAGMLKYWGEEKGRTFMESLAPADPLAIPPQLVSKPYVYR